MGRASFFIILNPELQGNYSCVSLFLKCLFFNKYGAHCEPGVATYAHRVDNVVLVQITCLRDSGTTIRKCWQITWAHTQIFKIMAPLTSKRQWQTYFLKQSEYVYIWSHAPCSCIATSILLVHKNCVDNSCLEVGTIMAKFNINDWQIKISAYFNKICLNTCKCKTEKKMLLTVMSNSRLANRDLVRQKGLWIT